MTICGCIQPLGLVVNSALAPFFLKEKLTRYHVFSTLLIILGTVVSVIFSIKPKDDDEYMNTSKFEHLLSRPMFLVWLGVLGIILVNILVEGFSNNRTIRRSTLGSVARNLASGGGNISPGRVSAASAGSLVVEGTPIVAGEPSEEIAAGRVRFGDHFSNETRMQAMRNLAAEGSVRLEFEYLNGLGDPQSFKNLSDYWCRVSEF